MTPDEMFLAQLKKDLFIGVISNGSIAQKERSIATAQEAFEFCTSHVGQAAVAPAKEVKKSGKTV